MTDPAERALKQMQERVNSTIVGPTGQPIAKPVVEDRTVTYAKDGESYSMDPEQLLMRAARMQRDGASLKAIKAELDLKNVSNRMLESALRLGHQLLDVAIRDGREPAESKRVVGYEMLDDEGEAMTDAEGEPLVIEVPEATDG